ncbi:hypothetical protein HRF69_13415 [Bacillus circulans]|uniref:hypothetical protein n=1 Tax=Niallia circulans TaxID=1397 RepID=UPI001560CB5F|nr:hypothetical protein [Niallia circulans]NRG28117.1 hypothetical protein [Niallia circulans]
MNRTVKPISEVIEMACKGFIPFKRNAFFYQGEIYEASLINKIKTSLLYYKENDTGTSIEFRFDENGNLIFVELKPDPDDYDYDEDYILFDSRWTDIQKSKAYHDLDNYKSNVYSLLDYKK